MGKVVLPLLGLKDVSRAMCKVGVKPVLFRKLTEWSKPTRKSSDASDVTEPLLEGQNGAGDTRPEIQAEVFAKVKGQDLRSAGSADAAKKRGPDQVDGAGGPTIRGG